MSSNKDSIVMDCFCGGGGFLKESFLLGRKFIGIDESKESVKLIQEWIRDHNTTNLNQCRCDFLSSRGESVLI